MEAFAECLRKELIFSAIGVVALASLGSCGTDPKYYNKARQDGTLGCFKETPEYFQGPASSPRLDDQRTQVLYEFAIERLNGLFTAKGGVFRHLFHDERDSGECTPDKRSAIDYHASISAFSTPPLPTPQAADADGEDQSDSVAGGDGAGSDSAKADSPDQGKKGATKPAAGKPAPAKKKGGASSTKPDTTQASDAFGAVQRVQIVISSYLYSNQPADRIDKVYALITPIDPGVEFLSVDQVAVNTQLIDFGKRTVQNEFDFSALPLGKSQGQLTTLTPKFTRNLERNIKRQFTNQNVEIFPLRNVLLVSEDGGPAEADIRGNKSVTVTLRIPVGSSLCRYHRIFDLSAENGKEDAYTTNDICYIQRVPAAIGAVALVRRVEWAADTVEEDDDYVQWVPFKSFSVFNLWTNPAELYGIDLGDEALVVKENGKTLERVLFGSLRAALKLRGLLDRARLDDDRIGALRKGVYHWDLGDKKNTVIPLGLDSGKGRGKSGKVTTCLYRPQDPDLNKYHIATRKEDDFCSFDD